MNGAIQQKAREAPVFKGCGYYPLAWGMQRPLLAKSAGRRSAGRCVLGVGQSGAYHARFITPYQGETRLDLPMLVLGLETSCDETGVALYDSERGLLS